MRTEVVGRVLSVADQLRHVAGTPGKSLRMTGSSRSAPSLVPLGMLFCHHWLATTHGLTSPSHLANTGLPDQSSAKMPSGAALQPSRRSRPALVARCNLQRVFSDARLMLQCNRKRPRLVPISHAYTQCRSATICRHRSTGRRSVPSSCRPGSSSRRSDLAACSIQCSTSSSTMCLSFARRSLTETR
jgi:hypothetical protein